MNNENNNGTVLGSTNQTPVPNSTPENTENIVNFNPENNGVENVNSVPTPEPINPVPVTPGPVPEPVMTPGMNQNVNPVTVNEVNNNPMNGPVPNIEPTMASQPEPSAEMPVQPQVASPIAGPQVGTPVPPQPSMESSNVPPVVPEPAYSNPQTINQNTIGTTPPISYEPEKKPKMKNNNKILFIIVIVLVLAVVGFGTFYVLKYTNILNKSSNEVTITTKNFEYDKGAALSSNIADYAVIRGTNTTNCVLNTESVDVNKPGVYEYTVTCGETHRTGKITIIDNAELIVNLSDVYKVKGDELNADEFAPANSNYTYEFVDSSEVENYMSSNPGTYTIKVRVTDSSTNKTTEVDGNLIILSNPLKGFLTCTSKEQNVENSNAKMVVNEKFAILDGSTVANAFGNVTYEIYEFTYTDEQEYSNLLEEYNNNGTITINNITGTTVFDETNKKITITNLRKNEEVVAEYGEDNLQSYSTIKKYFSGDQATQTQGLGYTCKYDKKQ